MADPEQTPVRSTRDLTAPSVFRPENLLREARRQKGLRAAPVPEICVLDPDGDLVRHIRRSARAERDPDWPCYHTELYRFVEAGQQFGAIPGAVGAPFAVLIAEQLFASGCRLLVSITSAGQVIARGPPPYFILIDRALRDEGTSHHYLPPTRFAEAPAHLLGPVAAALQTVRPLVHRGVSWTTDAPFRETASAIAAARDAGALAVEMEAAGLYAFATACRRDVLCFAHVTNQLGQIAGDFEKGEGDGAADALRILGHTARAWRGIGG